MTPKQQQALIKKIGKKYGSVIDLEAKPEVMIDILRSFGRVFDDPDGGAKPGGVGPPPCIVEGGSIALDDLMRTLLKINRDVASIKTSIGKRGG